MCVRLFILLTCFPILSCEHLADNGQLEQAQQLVASVKSEVAPDGRVAIFKIASIQDVQAIVLRGKTDQPDGKQSLLKTLSEKQIDYIDSIEVLPSSRLKGRTRGVINNSVANIRSAPKHSGELATQALLGMPVKVLDQEGEWYLVQTPDDYISWIDHGGLVVMNDEDFSRWQSKPKLIYQSINGKSYESQDESGVVSDLVLGDVLVLVGENVLHYEIAYPDGRSGFIRKSEASPLGEWVDSNENLANILIDHAQSLKGSPYLWGGTSTKGMDCSGFTKTLYHMNGLIIPRDASQQVHAGTLVDDKGDWSLFEPGDLLFFGTPNSEGKRERVVHVAMWIGNNSFIHASRQVRISSVDPAAPNYDEFNTQRYLRAKRYINNLDGNIIDLHQENIYNN